MARKFKGLVSGQLSLFDEALDIEINSGEGAGTDGAVGSAMSLLDTRYQAAAAAWTD